MRISHFRIGDPRSRREKPRAFRVYATRFPPRGIPRAEREAFGNFDVWFPLLAPSARLLAKAKRADLGDAEVRERFFARYERELMASAETRGALDLLAALSQRVPVSVGCYCADPAGCHRSRLVALIRRTKSERRGAKARR